MATIAQLESELRPYKLALVEAFGLDRYDVSSDISVDQEAVTVKYFGGPAGPPPGAVILSGDRESLTVEFPVDAWTEEQQQAVADYIGRFPSLGDFLGKATS